MEHLNSTGTLIADRRPGHLPWGLSLPTSQVCNFANPEGIPQQSPGLRGTSNPGFVALGRANPNGVVSMRAQRGHNPVGVEGPLAREPRVTRRLATLGWRAQALWD